MSCSPASGDANELRFPNTRHFHPVTRCGDDGLSLVSVALMLTIAQSLRPRSPYDLYPPQDVTVGASTNHCQVPSKYQGYLIRH